MHKEHKKCIKEGLCLHCHQPGNIAAKCSTQFKKWQQTVIEIQETSMQINLEWSMDNSDSKNDKEITKIGISGF